MIRRTALVSAAVVAGWALIVAPGTAQSPNAFGVPTADQPQPGTTIKAVRGSRAQGWDAQGRSEVLARHGMVATSDPLAAEAGLEILRNGGNAIDAAVAAGAVLDVMLDETSNSIECRFHITIGCHIRQGNPSSYIMPTITLI